MLANGRRKSRTDILRLIQKDAGICASRFGMRKNAKNCGCQGLARLCSDLGATNFQEGRKPFREKCHNILFGIQEVRMTIRFSPGVALAIC